MYKYTLLLTAALVISSSSFALQTSAAPSTGTQGDEGMRQKMMQDIETLKADKMKFEQDRIAVEQDRQQIEKMRQMRMQHRIQRQQQNLQQMQQTTQPAQNYPK